MKDELKVELGLIKNSVNDMLIKLTESTDDVSTKDVEMVHKLYKQALETKAQVLYNNQDLPF